ncbi:MAG TPA: amidase [Sandaracinaceae bacterium LLY-WYZ-13_1]|nr:amidase [Sandaracinaceae bacterium LLY-WYZ-13_1]
MPNEPETDPADMTVSELMKSYRDCTLSPVEATEAVLARAHRLDEELGAYLFLDEEAALEAARRSELRWARGIPMGELDGVPVAVKDSIHVRDWPNREGSVLTADEPDDIDSPVVNACRRHGAVLLGKTAMCELGWKAVTDSPLTGITRNPWDPRVTPGGSSGGSAAAVASGMANLALGADSGGSVRIPASFCGLVGHKPTSGRVPVKPGTHYGKLSAPGPLARTVMDAAILLDVMTELDVRDRPAPLDQAHGARFEESVHGLRVAFSPTLGFDVEPHPEVDAAVRRTARALGELGAVVDEADPDWPDGLREAYDTMYLGIATWTILGMIEDESDLERIDPELRTEVARYRDATMKDWLDADSTLVALSQRSSVFFSRYDLLLTPTVPIPPFEVGRQVPAGWPDERWTSWTPLTWPFNMTGQPACSVPCGFTSDGRPIGAQLVGARHDDTQVLGAAHALQQMMPLLDRRAPVCVER